MAAGYPSHVCMPVADHKYDTKIQYVQEMGTKGKIVEVDKINHYVYGAFSLNDPNDPTKGGKMSFPFDLTNDHKKWEHYLGNLLYCNLACKQAIKDGKRENPHAKYLSNLWDSLDDAITTWFLAYWNYDYTADFNANREVTPLKKYSLSLPDLILPWLAKPHDRVVARSNLFELVRSGVQDLGNRMAFTACLYASTHVSYFYAETVRTAESNLKLVIVHDMETFHDVLNISPPNTTALLQTPMDDSELVMATLIWLCAMGKSATPGMNVEAYFNKRFKAVISSIGLSVPGTIRVLLNNASVKGFEQIWSDSTKLRKAIFEGFLRADRDPTVSAEQKALANQVMMLCEHSGMKTINFIKNWISQEESAILLEPKIVEEIEKFQSAYTAVVESKPAHERKFLRMLNESLSDLSQANFPNITYCAIVRAIAQDGAKTMTKYKMKGTPTLSVNTIVMKMNIQIGTTAGPVVATNLPVNVQAYLNRRHLDPTISSPMPQQMCVSAYVSPP